MLHREVQGERLLQLPRGAGKPDTPGWFSFGGLPSMEASPQTSASVIDFNGHAMDALLTSTYLEPEMHILTLRIASRHKPEAGAVCGSFARTNLCGGGR